MTHDAPYHKDQVTIRDVARHAGVSIASVSRVVARSALASPELVDRVNASVSALGYSPNKIAQALSIGMQPSVHILSGLSDAIGGKVMHSIIRNISAFNKQVTAHVVCPDNISSNIILEKHKAVKPEIMIILIEKNKATDVCSELRKSKVVECYNTEIISLDNVICQIGDKMRRNFSGVLMIAISNCKSSEIITS